MLSNTHTHTQNETQNPLPSCPNDLKTKISKQNRIQWPLIHTICSILGVHTQQAEIHKSPLGSLLSSLSSPWEGWKPWTIWKMWPPLKCFHGHPWRRERSAEVRITEHRLTHRSFFSTPPPGSALPLERGPRCSSSPSRNSAGSWGRSVGSPSISSRCWKWFLPGRET